jgi:hypothetical protein
MKHPDGLSAEPQIAPGAYQGLCSVPIQRYFHSRQPGALVAGNQLDHAPLGRPHGPLNLGSIVRGVFGVRGGRLVGPSF